MVVVFVGIASALSSSRYRWSRTTRRAPGAIALADQRMEYIRSLAYCERRHRRRHPHRLDPAERDAELQRHQLYASHLYRIRRRPEGRAGLVGHQRHHRGLQGGQGPGPVDRETSGSYNITLVTRVSPTAGLETNVPGGTLTIFSVNSLGAALPGASVTIVNASSTSCGQYQHLHRCQRNGLDPRRARCRRLSDHRHEPGVFDAQTYSTTAQNTNPNPGNLTVTNNHTTSATFAIDLLGTKTVNTWTQTQTGTSSDPFNNTSLIATSTGIVDFRRRRRSSPIGSTTGEVQSVAFGPSSSIAGWGTFSWSDSQPASTSIRYRVYDGAGADLDPRFARCPATRRASPAAA